MKLANEEITKMGGILNTVAVTYTGVEKIEKKWKANTIPLWNPAFTKTKGAPQTRKVPGGRQNCCSNCKKCSHNKYTCHCKCHWLIDSRDPSNSYFSSDDTSIDLGANFDDPWAKEIEQEPTFPMQNKGEYVLVSNHYSNSTQIPTTMPNILSIINGSNNKASSSNQGARSDSRRRDVVVVSITLCTLVSGIILLTNIIAEPVRTHEILVVEKV